MNRFSAITHITLVAALSLGCVNSAMADDDEGGSWWKWGKSNRNEGGRNRNEGGGYGGGGMASAAPPAYQKECASCHMAYPAGLLPAGSWQHMMANLNQHFGNDASLDAATASSITQYLTGNAGTYKRVNEMPPQDRITQSYWFSRKHDKEISPNVWSRKSIGSRSNCVACHQGAERGDFNEHSVNIPN